MPRLIAALIVFASVASAALGETPKVALSEAHRSQCRVRVGDTLPDLPLKTPNGDAQPLAPLLGKRATVVVFYQSAAASKGWMTRTLLADLGPDVADRFGDQGVATAAISVGGPPTSTTGAGVLSLVDATGGAFAKVGTGRLPRVYVVDPKGRVLWFDIEYSNSTRRELRQTLQTFPGE
ncbi:MAG: hypothetical protein AAGB00_11990 [Planctomycetota bacterium]